MFDNKQTCTDAGEAAAANNTHKNSTRGVFNAPCRRKMPAECVLQAPHAGAKRSADAAAAAAAAVTDVSTLPWTAPWLTGLVERGILLCVLRCEGGQQKPEKYVAFRIYFDPKYSPRYSCMLIGTSEYYGGAYSYIINTPLDEYE